VLAALFIATRGHHFASITAYQRITRDVFPAGYIYDQPAVFPALLAPVCGLDYAAITVGGVSSFCVTPAYGFFINRLMGVLWLAGRWFAKRYSFSTSALYPLVVA